MISPVKSFKLWRNLRRVDQFNLAEVVDAYVRAGIIPEADRASKLQEMRREQIIANLFELGRRPR